MRRRSCISDLPGARYALGVSESGTATRCSRRAASEAIQPGGRYLRGITKRLIEVDDDKLDAVRELLGARTLKATVDEAFDEVLALDRRRRALLTDSGVEDILVDPADRGDAWG